MFSRRALVGLPVLAAVAWAGAASAQSAGWWESIQDKQDHVTGNLDTRFTLDDLGAPAGPDGVAAADPGSGSGSSGSAGGGGGGAGGGSSSGGGGGSSATAALTPDAGGPVAVGDIDPHEPATAQLILTWLREAEPPENATEGARFRYSNSAVKIGTTRDGGIITARHDPPVPDPVWLWANRRGQDSVDHCTMEEYVTLRAGDQPIDHCRGRYVRVPATASTTTPAETKRPPTSQPAPAPAPSSPPTVAGAAPGGSIGGTWDTTYGTMELPDVAAGAVRAPYDDDNGRIVAELDGATLTGVWIEDGSDRECATQRDGSFAWGRIAFVFDPERETFSGRWGYCDEAPSRDWDGTRTGDGVAPDDIIATVFEPGIDRPGGDYVNYEMRDADPAICQAQCRSESACLAWTFVHPGLQGKFARCWLKSSVPEPIERDCCVSGVIAARAPAFATPAPSPTRPETPAPPPQVAVAPPEAPPPPANTGRDYFVGLWALSASACAGHAPSVASDDDDFLGIGAALEEALSRMGFELHADGSFSVIDVVAGSSERVGTWSATDDSLSMVSQTSGFDSTTFGVRDRRPDRFTGFDQSSGESVPFWRCR